MDALLAASAPGVHWVLAGRCLPGINLSAWRLRDQLEVLDGDDLAFDAAQLAQLGRKLMDEPPSRAQTERLLGATQGWAAGVKLGLLAMARRRDAEAALAHFDGGHVEVAAYLDSEVLHEQPQRLQDFLVATSVVDLMTGELCDALLGRNSSQAVLEQMERGQLFITAQDSHGLAFRYHPLFHGFLRSRLAADPARKRTLHERASRWYARQQRFDEALAHAFASGRLAWCAELMERAAAQRWQATGDIAEVVQWCEKLPREQFAARPALSVTYAARPHGAWSSYGPPRATTGAMPPGPMPPPRWPWCATRPTASPKRRPCAKKCGPCSKPAAPTKPSSPPPARSHACAPPTATTKARCACSTTCTV